MEKFIALIFCLPLLVVFIPQFGLNTVNTAMINEGRAIVETAKEAAKQEGYFTPEIKEEMLSNLSKIGFDRSEISLNFGSNSPSYRYNSYDGYEDYTTINYDVGLPLKKLIAGGSLFGIEGDDNKSVYHIRGKIASERVPEESELPGI